MKLMADKELPLYPIKTVLNFLQRTLQFKNGCMCISVTNGTSISVLQSAII